MKTNKGPLLISLGSALWATDALFRSRLVKDFSSTFIVFIEHILSLIVTLPLLLKNRKQLLKFDLKDWISLVFISLGGSVLALIFFTKSFAITSNYTVPVLIQKLQPIIAILLATVILKETLSKRFWLWSIIAILGAYFVSFGAAFTFTSLSEATTLPVLYALLAAFFWGGSTVFGRYLSQKYTFGFITAARYVAGVIWLILIILVQGQFIEIGKIDAQSLGIFFLMAFIPGFLALLIYYYGLKNTKASIATICELTFPVTAVILNWIFLGSALTIGQIIGTVVLLAAITLLSYENTKK